MKTFRMIGMALFAVLMCVNFASCSSDDNLSEEPEKEEGGVVVSGKKLTKIVFKSDNGDNYTETYTFSYDNQGRLIEATEIYEDEYEKETDTYQFTWGDDAIKVNERSNGGSYADNYTLTLKDGLVQSSTNDDEIFTYNQSNRFVRGENEWSTTTAIWDGSKLMSVTEDDDDDATLTYEKSCQKGYFPFIASIIDFSCVPLFMAHPEIAGMRTNQLPASITWTYSGYDDDTETSILSYEFDNEGYVSKIKSKDGGSYTLTWK